jgi:SAM-dependent methyltransferase
MNNEETSLLKDLSKGHPDRDAVAEQIAKARQIDRHQTKERWTDSRDGEDYVGELQGLQATLDWVRQYGKNKTVLDIGTGIATGITEISRSYLGRNLNFVATNLTKQPLAYGDLNEDSLKITMAETLRGIPDNSVDCVLAVHSISYSAKPQYVVSAIDRVLSENGIIKAVFRGEDASPRLEEKRAEDFSDEFRKLGYKVSISHPRLLIKGQSKKAIDLLVAVKTPGDLMPEIIMAEDKKNLLEQLNLFS